MKQYHQAWHFFFQERCWQQQMLSDWLLLWQCQCWNRTHLIRMWPAGSGYPPCCERCSECPRNGGRGICNNCKANSDDAKVDREKKRWYSNLEIRIMNMGVTVNLKNIPAKAWIIIALGVFFLLVGITYSFIRGWSTITYTKKKPPTGSEAPASPR